MFLHDYTTLQNVETAFLSYSNASLVKSLNSLNDFCVLFTVTDTPASGYGCRKKLLK